jgi:hypothetical protein
MSNPGGNRNNQTRPRVVPLYSHAGSQAEERRLGKADGKFF